MAVDIKHVVPVAPAPLAEIRRYKFVDYAAQAYLGIIGLLVLFFHGDRLAVWPWLAVAHFAGMIGIHLLLSAYQTRPQAGLLTFARLAYPLLLVPPLYRETGLVNLLITGKYHDPAFVALEEALFGFQPVVRFMEALPYRGVAELLYMAYFSYYVLVVGVGIALYLRDRQQCFHYVSLVSFIFFVCYLAFIIAPVLGPKAILIPAYAELSGMQYPVPPYPPAVESAFFYRVMTVIHGKYQVIGAAFPSSHVAVTAGVLYFAWIRFRRVRYLILIDVILLALSTVYCRYHYAVDVFAGILLTAALLPLGERLYRRYR